MKKRLALFLAVVLAACPLVFTSCAEDASVNSEDTPPAYSDISDTVNAYEEDLSQYLEENPSGLGYIYSEGYTPSGIPCSSAYASSPDGQFKTVTLNISYEDHMCVDEYYQINDSLILIVRNDTNPDGTPEDEQRFVSVNIKLYSVDDENQTLTVVEQPDTLDIYLSFDEITELYGAQAQ